MKMKIQTSILTAVIEALDMKVGRLATETFGRPTDAVFTVIEVEPSKRERLAAEREG